MEDKEKNFLSNIMVALLFFGENKYNNEYEEDFTGNICNET